MQPIIQRSGRLVVGVSDQPQKKVVFYGLNYPLFRSGRRGGATIGGRRISRDAEAGRCVR